MALARRIPIQYRIFTTESLARLLKELSGYYRKSNHEYLTNRYSLSISEDEDTTVSVDSPPRSFEPFLNSPITYLRLRIECSTPDRDIELTLSPGDNAHYNCIVLQSPDEDWVNCAYTDLSKLLKNVEPQSVFIRRNLFWLIPLFTLWIGWALKKVFLFVLLKMGAARPAEWSWELLGQHLMISVVLGLFPTIMFFAYITGRAFPGIEFQIGPNHLWKEAKMRNQLNFLLGLLIIGPLGSLVYDVYGFIVKN